MKKLLILAACATLLNGCMAYTGIYKVGLKEVETPKNVKEQYGDTRVVNFDDKGVTKYSYEDGLIKIIWLPQKNQFSFNLTNKSDHSIKIIWDEAVYVDETGSSKKVFHSGVKYTDRTNSQPPTTIVKGANLDDLVMPTDNAYFVSGQYGGWQEKPLFINYSSTPEGLNAIKLTYIGKTVKVLLPIKIEETVNEYLFTFLIEDFISK